MPFFRGKQAAQESTGAGLGLAIASKAIMRHGGTIKAYNLTPSLQNSESSDSQSGLKVVIMLPSKL